MDHTQAINIVRQCVAESLALDVEEVQLSSRLVPDLGADSLDFVDLVFMLEKKFHVKLQGGAAEFMSQLDFSSPDVMVGSYLTRGTVERVQAMLPGLAPIPDPEHITPRELFSLLTVETLWKMVEQKLEPRDA